MAGSSIELRCIRTIARRLPQRLRVRKLLGNARQEWHGAPQHQSQRFNDRKLKLGTFGTNLDRGCAISTIDGVLQINWPNTLELAKISEAMEFEALGADRPLAWFRRGHQFQRSGLLEALRRRPLARHVLSASSLPRMCRPSIR